MYKAAGWTKLGCTKGYARANGRYTDPHGVPKDLNAFSLRRDTRHRTCAPDPLPDPLLPNPMGCASEPPSDDLDSLYEKFLRVPDFRRAQGRKHATASVFAIIIFAHLSGFESGIATAQYARALNQTEVETLGAWINSKTRKYEPPSKSVIYRVLQLGDRAVTETVLKRWATPRVDLDAALAADGKRLRAQTATGTTISIPQLWLRMTRDCPLPVTVFMT